MSCIHTFEHKGHLVEIKSAPTTRFLVTLIDGKHRRGLPNRRNLKTATVDALKSIENQMHYGYITDMEEKRNIPL